MTQSTLIPTTTYSHRCMWNLFQDTCLCDRICICVAKQNKCTPACVSILRQEKKVMSIPLHAYYYLVCAVTVFMLGLCENHYSGNYRGHQHICARDVFSFFKNSLTVTKSGFPVWNTEFQHSREHIKLLFKPTVHVHALEQSFQKTQSLHNVV